MGYFKKHHGVSDSTKGMSEQQKNAKRIEDAKKARNTKYIGSKAKATKGKGNR